ncbi:MAG: TonB-dependent receptor [Synergistaceae bacterium]|nr:TonB-dependent receptor [Synergistaceae bacterium]
MKRHCGKALAALGLLLCLTLPAKAAPVEFQEVVTGSRLAESLEEVAAPAYVIEREAIESSGALSLGELLETLPGIYSPRPSGRTTDDTLRIRGLTTEVLLLVDGIPYNKATHVEGAAAYDLRSIPLESIERIEVIKGAGSALYGSHAAAGVINIITRKPLAEGDYRILAEAGTHDWHRLAAWASVPGERVSASFWYSHQEEGTSPLAQVRSLTGAIAEDRNLDFSSDSGGIRLAWGRWLLGGEWGHYRSEWEYSYDNFNPDGTITFVEGSRNSQTDDYQRYTLTYRATWGDIRGYWHDQKKEIVDNWGTPPLEDRAWGLEVSRRTALGENPLAWGVAFRREEGSFNFLEGERTNVAPFAELSLLWGEMMVDLGLRYETWDVDNADDQEEWIPKASFSFQADNGNLWYLTAGRFFAMPSFFQIANPFGATNPGLRPEKGWSYELGLKGRDGRNQPWSAALFYLAMDDKIKWDDRNTPDWSDDRYSNVAEFRAWGVEIQKDWLLSDRLTWRSALAWQKTEEKETALSDWGRTGFPGWDIYNALFYRSGPWETELGVHFYGDREKAGYSGVADDDYVTVDAKIGWKGKGHNLQLAAYNLFDETYYVSDNFDTRYYGPERRLYLTWEYRF